MRSTRRIDRYGPLLAAGLGAAIIAYVAFLAPPEPQAPRWDGAGSTEPQHGGTFVFHHESVIRTFDPAIAYDELSSMGIRLLFDGLLDYDDETRLIPSLVEVMPTQSEDGKTFTFRLRRGVEFHCGGELTADDVLFTMERMLGPDAGSPGYVFYANIAGVEEYRAGDTEHIRGIRVIDERTIEFTLDEPDQTFLNAMAMPFAYPLPRSHYENPTVDIRTTACGTGPFTLDPDDWEHGVEAVFERNPNYWNAPLPYVDRMIYQENLTPNLWGVGMNTQMAPFDNVHVRRAVAFAVDREAWKRQRSNRLMPTGQPLPRGFMGYRADLEGAHYTDLDRAREEMALAGHPVHQDGDMWVAEGLEEDEIEFWVGEGDTGRQYGEMAQADLAKIGLRISIKQISFPVYLEESGKPGRVRLLLTGWNMDFPDPANFLDVLFNSSSISEQNSNNRSFYSNPVVDDILDRARVEQDLAVRERMYVEAQELIVADAPWAFMWSDLTMEAWQPYVRGYQPSPVFSMDYREVWLDLPKRRMRARVGAGHAQTHRLSGLLPLPGTR
ncbi:MAG: ABC transporter substrate-binding protein [Deltaproteobacteria bacterium]|nr:ABC transporter substrate-binding protein [Deltaproteobacteria bacterium]